MFGFLKFVLRLVLSVSSENRKIIDDFCQKVIRDYHYEKFGLTNATHEYISIINLIKKSNYSYEKLHPYYIFSTVDDTEFKYIKKISTEQKLRDEVVKEKAKAKEEKNENKVIRVIPADGKIPVNFKKKVIKKKL